MAPGHGDPQCPGAGGGSIADFSRRRRDRTLGRRGRRDRPWGARPAESLVKLHHPDGSLATANDLVAMDPVGAGWSYTGLRVFDVCPGEIRRFRLEGNEGALIPLRGSFAVEGPGYRFDLRHRASVFESMPDVCYLPLDDDIAVSSDTGGRMALATSAATERKEARFLGAANTTV